MNSLIASTFNEYFTTNYVGKVQEVLLNIDYFIADPHKKGLSAFIYIKSNNLDGELKKQ